MIDFDRAGLERLLPAAAGSADWGDVLHRARVRQRLRRRRALVLVAAALVVVVATASAVAGVRAFLLDRGFIGLPPQDATPSTPGTSELVMFYGGPTPGARGRTHVWVYADGRVISLRHAARPDGANELSTGYLEQRLTASGVELMRTEAISNSFPDHLRPDGGVLAWETRIEVFDDGVMRVRRAIDRDRLGQFESWLPTDAWADQRVKAYVAVRYAVCWGGELPNPIRASQVLELLPAPVEAALTRHGVVPTPWGGWPVHECSVVPTNGAREIARELEGAGLTHHGDGDWWSRVRAYRLVYRFTGLDAPIRDGRPQVYFEPVLPHGEWTCSACA